MPPRVYLHYDAYRYVPRFGDPVSLGRDYAEAMRKLALLKQPVSQAGTIGALLDWHLVNVAKKKAARTYSDNIKEAVYLGAGLGHIPMGFSQRFKSQERARMDGQSLKGR